MRARSKTNKVIDIALSEEKFYFPGETIKGSVIVKPKSSIKANPIVVKFSGAIFISAKDKEVIPLFQTSKSLPINDGKSKVLEAKTYSFPFEFVVPDNLPSAMDFGKNKIAKIYYKLTAILDRPMMPESLCPKIEYPVLVLEYVDVTKENFTRPLDKQKQVVSSQIKCHTKLSVPRTGFTRGETIPVNIVVNTFQTFVKREALVVDLVRKVKISTAKNTLDEEHILKSNKFDLNIIGPYNFSQSITSQLLIRPTPPTVRYKDKVMRIHYKIRAQVFTSDQKKTPTCVIELPLVIGTWPRADVPIDDDDDEDIIQNMGEMMISDEIDDDDDDDEQQSGETEEDAWIKQQEELEFRRHSTFNNTGATTHGGQVRRSGSNGSLGSMSSWISQSTMDRRISAGTSPTTTTTTMTSATSGSSSHHSMIPVDTYQRNTLPPVGGFKMSNGYLNRSTSTPDLLSNPPPPPPQQNRTRVIDPTLRSSYYEPTTPSPSSENSVGHRPSKSMHTIHPSFLNFTASQSPPQQQQQASATQHCRLGSDEFSSYNYNQVTPNEPQVPNHTLTFLSSSVVTPTTPPRLVTQQQHQQPYESNNASSLDETSESDSDFDEDDLFAIIEKKKKKEEKELRKRQQRSIYTLTE
ncbi:hypothetical protein MAM1_0662d11086 [Mucor ambiguus]|uniref:Arrestin C-terminal-like domain-containing protein n=1 Tax=Mucor ambiguus TaxID=91626 RepID=A0A0C9N624_9FUNG|nr:hypothetical protein MAM1_0662d11086 [Mucor ambiguus]